MSRDRSIYRPGTIPITWNIIQIPRLASKLLNTLFTFNHDTVIRLTFSPEKTLEANIDYIRKRFKAVDFLRPDCHPDLQPVPYLAYYGVAVTRDELYDYATRKGLQPDPWYESEVGRRLCMYRAAVKLLSAKIEFPFELRMPLNPDFQWNIALYSNYVVDDEKLIPEDEEFV
ncbi:hypothetical protein BDY19DRAFT_911006, partial [Irpex rosettiformis]